MRQALRRYRDGFRNLRGLHFLLHLFVPHLLLLELAGLLLLYLFLGLGYWVGLAFIDPSGIDHTVDTSGAWTCEFLWLAFIGAGFVWGLIDYGIKQRVKRRRLRELEDTMRRAREERAAAIIAGTWSEPVKPTLAEETRAVAKAVRRELRSSWNRNFGTRK